MPGFDDSFDSSAFEADETAQAGEELSNSVPDPTPAARPTAGTAVLSEVTAYTHLIYGLVDPRDHLIHYVGRSANGLHRPHQHKTKHVSAAMRDWQSELTARGLMQEIVVLEVVPTERAYSPAVNVFLPWWLDGRNTRALSAAEGWWIAYGRASGWPLLNIADGASGGHYHKARPETVERRRAKLIGKRRSAEYRRRQSERFKGRPQPQLRTKEVHEKSAASRRGLKRTPAQRAKMSVAQSQRHRDAVPPWLPLVLGAAPDRVVGEVAGKSVPTICAYRNTLGIPTFRTGKCYKESLPVWFPLVAGTVTDRVVGSLVGLSEFTISKHRNSLGIPAFRVTSRSEGR